MPQDKGDSFFGPRPDVGTPELQLPDELREPLRDHLEQLREYYIQINWAQRAGFGQRPALVVIDLALGWTQPGSQMGSNVDPVVEATCDALAAARQANIPIFFTSWDLDVHELPELRPKKCISDISESNASLYDLDPRLERRPNEKLFLKRYASCFKGTNFHQMLTSLGVDTLIVTGLSTSHCVYATCRDATECFHVIIPREAVGERCEIMHMVNLVDMDIDLGDVMPLTEVADYLENLPLSDSSTPT